MLSKNSISYLFVFLVFSSCYKGELINFVCSGNLEKIGRIGLLQTTRNLFPYTERDTLIFKNQDQEERIFTASEHFRFWPGNGLGTICTDPEGDLNHESFFHASCEYFRVTFVNTEDSLEIRFLASVEVFQEGRPSYIAHEKVKDTILVDYIRLDLNTWDPEAQQTLVRGIMCNLQRPNPHAFAHLGECQTYSDADNSVEIVTDPFPYPVFTSNTHKKIFINPVTGFLAYQMSPLEDIWILDRVE